MKLKYGLYVWLLLMILRQISAVSYNVPKFCPNASWNRNAGTFAKTSTIGLSPYDIFINTNNTIYVPNRQNGRLVVWSQRSTMPTRNISDNLVNPYSLFVTTAGDIYVDTYSTTGGVSKWTLNGTNSIPIMYTCGRCYDLFVDINNTLYCSMSNFHKIVSKSLNSDSNAFKIVGGTGSPKSALNTLHNPHGIFVDTTFDLYVADSRNNRIQLFRLGQLKATTVAGSKSSKTAFTLNYPTGIVLDADKHLFIVDSGNNRIVGSNSKGFRCLVGCSGSSGSASNKLNHPWSLSFDSYGNIFVTDQGNSRIQTFMLLTNSCNDSTTSGVTITSTLYNVEHSSSFLSTATNGLNNVITNTSKIVSYNQPKFDAFACWSANAITFATGSTVGFSSYSIFVNSNNTVYVPILNSDKIIIWFHGSNSLTTKIAAGLSNPYSIFVTTNGDIYVNNGNSNGRVDKLTLNPNNSIPVMNVDSACYGLFVDIGDTLYCSMSSSHQVVTKSLNSSLNAFIIAAGTGCPNSASNTLDNPHGIFVDTNFDLYVADSANNRIQLFQLGQLSGITKIGNRSSNIAITLNYPTGIVLDTDKYLFIVDSGNNRIVGSNSNGFRCLVGCSGSSGSASNKLNNPSSLSFDSYGNIFVTDQNNSRIQKFLLSTNSCNQTTSSTTTTTSSTTTTTTINYTQNLSNFSIQPTIEAITIHQKEITSIQTTTLMIDTTDSISSTYSSTTTNAPPSSFVVPTCPDQNTIGTGCNTSSAPCDMLKPFQNNGSCTNTNTTAYGYNCTCLRGFDGAQCQIDNRPCKPNTCWNNGTCNETSNTTFECSCQNGWRGIHCEAIVNYCENVECLNNGVCRPSFLNYTCQCLGTYSGRYCEIVATTTVVRKAVTKSFGYIAILFLIFVVSFFVIMDVLKYCFGIDPVEKDLEKIRKAKLVKKYKRPPVIQKFVYVNAPSQRPPIAKVKKQIMNTKGTAVAMNN